MPLSDGIRPQRFPIVNVLLILANLAVWLFYELPHLDSSVATRRSTSCSVNGIVRPALPWYVSWFTAMFMHASWSHLLGNMWFLGDLRQERRGRVRALAVSARSMSPAGSRRPRPRRS